MGTGTKVRHKEFGWVGVVIAINDGVHSVRWENGQVTRHLSTSLERVE